MMASTLLIKSEKYNCRVYILFFRAIKFLFSVKKYGVKNDTKALIPYENIFENKYVKTKRLKSGVKYFSIIKFQGNSNVSSETEAQVWIKAGESSTNEDNTTNPFVKESSNDETLSKDEVKENLKQKGIKEKHDALSPYFKKLFSIESIISKLGIILLLIGVGFIFKLSYDKGYITQEGALIIGGLIGVALCFFGFRTSAKSRLVLSQVLFGGGIAVFYITAYAAYLRYGILGGFFAFIFRELLFKKFV